MTHVNYWRLLVLCLLAAAQLGCKSLARPQWLHPGPTDYQRARAMQYDPYMDPYAGGDISGTRPRDYDNPQDTSQRYPLFRGQ